ETPGTLELAARPGFLCKNKEPIMKTTFRKAVSFAALLGILLLQSCSKDYMTCKTCYYEYTEIIQFEDVNNQNPVITITEGDRFTACDDLLRDVENYIEETSIEGLLNTSGQEIIHKTIKKGICK
ncbi:MAG TPA: hypothetical protein PK122_06520, partial [Candidatus Paceibacterota bacterium]|nr:hypothetical protein [Candidatus Paceibacterota bacterium]